jgi:hypothetical protein
MGALLGEGPDRKGQGQLRIEPFDVGVAEGYHASSHPIGRTDANFAAP